MNYFRVAALHDAAHDVEGGVVAIKERGGSDETDFVVGLIWCVLLHNRLVAVSAIFRRKITHLARPSSTEFCLKS